MFRTFFHLTSTQMGLEHLKGTERALIALGHLALDGLGHLKDTWALEHSRLLGLGQSATTGLRHSKGTWALKALETFFGRAVLNFTKKVIIRMFSKTIENNLNVKINPLASISKGFLCFLLIQMFQ